MATRSASSTRPSASSSRSSARTAFARIGSRPEGHHPVGPLPARRLHAEENGRDVDEDARGGAPGAAGPDRRARGGRSRRPRPGSRVALRRRPGRRLEGESAMREDQHGVGHRTAARAARPRRCPRRRRRYGPAPRRRRPRVFRRASSQPARSPRTAPEEADGASLGSSSSTSVGGCRWMRLGGEEHGERDRQGERAREERAARVLAGGAGRRAGSRPRRAISSSPVISAVGSGASASRRLGLSPDSGGVQRHPHRVGVLEPLLGALRERAVHHRGEGRRHRRVEARERRRLLVEVGGEHRHGVGRHEGRAPAHHLVEEHAQGVEVAAGVGRGAAGLLRREVGRGPQPASRPLPLNLGDAEVEQLHEVGVVLGLEQHHVGGLDVAVDDARLVGLAEGAEKLLADGGGAGLGQPPLAPEDVEEVLAVEVLHGQVEPLVSLQLAEVEDGDGVRDGRGARPPAPRCGSAPPAPGRGPAGRAGPSRRAPCPSGRARP